MGKFMFLDEVDKFPDLAKKRSETYGTQIMDSFKYSHAPYNKEITDSIKNSGKPVTKTVSEWANEQRIIPSGIPDFVKSDLNKSYSDFQNSLNKIIQERKKMKHSQITIKIVNNGFHVTVGCQEFVFTNEKELFQAISDYKKDPEKAEEKYCK